MRFSRPDCRRTGMSMPLLMTALMFGLLALQSGCASLVANLINVAGGDKVPAAYDGLRHSRVAVVTMTENGMFKDDVSARILGRNVAQWLTENVKKIELVREEKITDWRDSHGWDKTDFVQIGRDVGAEKVLAIEVPSLKLRDGATLYRGRADVEITVYDVETDSVVYRHSLEDYTYPKTAGQYAGDMSESNFRKLYLGILAKRVARRFFPYDATEDYALDSISAR